MLKLQKHAVKTSPKALVLVSKNKIKRKSKCAICFIEKTFIDEIEDKYDLESELEIEDKLFKLFTDSYYKRK